MSMRAILPHLTKAAVIGAVLGAGIELVWKPPVLGQYLTTSVVASMALRTLGYYLGAGTVVGASIGALTGASYSLTMNGRSEENSTLLIIKTALGGALIGGTLGYLIGAARPLADMTVKILK